MLGEQVAALGTVAVEEALACQAAAGKGQQIDLTVIPGANALGIKGGVDQDHDTLLLIGAQQRPGKGYRHGYDSKGQQEPPKAHTSGKGHADEDEDENQGHAGIAGQDHVQAHQDTQVQHHVHNRRNTGNVILVGSHY